jgi:hypothetical protein
VSRRTSIYSIIIAVSLTFFAFQNCSPQGDPSTGALTNQSVIGGCNLTQGPALPILSPGLSLPINYQYNVVTWTCGANSALPSSGVTVMAVGNTAGYLALPAGTDGCVTTTSLNFSYLDSTHISAQPETTSCSAACTPTDCTPGSAAGLPARTYTYQFNVADLLLSRTLAAGDIDSQLSTDGCNVGDTESLDLSPVLCN